MSKKVSKNKTLAEKVKKPKAVKTVTRKPRKSKVSTSIPAYDANGSFLDDYDYFVEPDNKKVLKRRTKSENPVEPDPVLESSLVEEEKQLNEFLENVARAEALALYAKKPWYEKLWDFLKAMFS